MENSELGSLVGGIGSAALGLYGFLSSLPYVGSVFIVLMTVSFTYFFNARIQTSAREYERRRLQTTEVLGPVYGQITRNVSLLERKKAALDMDLGQIVGTEWDGIENGYKAQLIDGKLRSSISQFFFDLDRLGTLIGPAKEMLRRIESDVWTSIFGPLPGNEGWHSYSVIDDYRHERSGLICGVVFWEKDPTKQFNMKWNRVDVMKAIGKPNGYPVQPEKDEVPGIMARFLPDAEERASKNMEVVNTRAEYERVLKEGYELRESLQKMISQWAKP